MASPAQYADAMRPAGLIAVRTVSRNAWYRDQARLELARLQNNARDQAALLVGRDFVNHNTDIWARMIPVLDSGEHCPTHLFGRKP